MNADATRTLAAVFVGWLLGWLLVVALLLEPDDRLDGWSTPPSTTPPADVVLHHTVGAPRPPG